MYNEKTKLLLTLLQRYIFFLYTAIFLKDFFIQLVISVILVFLLLFDTLM